MTIELIQTENLLLISNQNNARLLRLKRKENEKNQIILNNIQQNNNNLVIINKKLTNELIETENSRLVIQELNARELRRNKKNINELKSQLNELNQKLEDTIYELDSIKDQNNLLEEEKNQLNEKINDLNKDIIHKDSLNKGLMDKLVEETNAHKETIEKHHRDEEARIAAIPKKLNISTQTEPDPQLELYRLEIEKLTKELQTAQSNNNLQLNTINQLTKDKLQLQTSYDDTLASYNLLTQQFQGLEDKNHILDIKLKASNYEIEHMTNDYNELTEQEQKLKELIQQKEHDIKLLQKELNELLEKEKNYLFEINYLKERNKEMSHTLIETNNSLEVLQNELNNLKLTIKSNSNQQHEQELQQHNNQKDDNDNNDDDDFHKDQPDESSRTYSGNGNGHGNKHLNKKNEYDNSISYESSDGEGYGVRGIRKRSQKKKKKEIKGEELVLPNIHQRGNSGSEEKDGSGSLFSNLTADEKSSIIKESHTKKTQTPNEYDERHQQHQRLLELRLKSGGCTLCGKKIKGEPKRLPSSLKNLVVEGYEHVKSPVSRQIENGLSDNNNNNNNSNNNRVISSRESERPSNKKRSESPNQSVVAEVVFAGYPIVENHLDHQLAIRDKYTHPRGQHCIFCSWDCAKKWNSKNTPVNLRYETHKLICIAAGSFE